MIATLVEKGTYILRNVPDLRDIRTLVALLESLGLEVEKLDANSYKIINNGLSGAEASYDLVKKMRASFLVMGGMLAIEKRGKVALPGGCAIGARPVDLHLKGFEALGAKINIEHGYVEATTENGLRHAENLHTVRTILPPSSVLSSIPADYETLRSLLCTVLYSEPAIRLSPICK